MRSRLTGLGNFFLAGGLDLAVGKSDSADCFIWVIIAPTEISSSIAAGFCAWMGAGLITAVGAFKRAASLSRRRCLASSRRRSFQSINHVIKRSINTTVDAPTRSISASQDISANKVKPNKVMANISKTVPAG